MENWTSEEVENLINMLYSADESNVLLAFELINTKPSADEFAEALSFLSLVEEYSSLGHKADELLSEKVKTALIAQCEADLHVFRKEWSLSNKAYLEHLRYFEKKIDVYGRFIELKPSYASKYKSIAYKLCRSFNQLNWGLSYYAKAVKLLPDDAHLHFDYAFNLPELPKNNDLIIYHYEQCKALGVNDKAVYHNLGRAYFRLKNNYKKAEEIFLQGLAIAPKFAETMIELGMLMKRTGRYQEAEAQLLKAIQTNPKSCLAYNNIACLYWENLKEYDKALDAINNALKIKPKSGLYWHTLAEVEWYGFRNKENALAALHKAEAVEKKYKAGREMIKEIENQ